MTLFVFPQSPKLLLSPAVCAHPHPHRLRPGARGGREGSHGGFPSLILFFLSPFQPVPFPSTKKEKKKKEKHK